MMNKKGQTKGTWEEYFKVFLWVLVFALLTYGLYRLLNYLTT